MTRPSGVYRAVVTEANGARYKVRIPTLGSRVHYGPVEMVENPYTDGLTTGLSADDEPHTHPHRPLPLAVGDRVVVAFLEGRQDDLVILGRLP